MGVGSRRTPNQHRKTDAHTPVEYHGAFLSPNERPTYAIQHETHNADRATKGDDAATERAGELESAGLGAENGGFYKSYFPPGNWLSEPHGTLPESVGSTSWRPTRTAATTVDSDADSRIEAEISARRDKEASTHRTLSAFRGRDGGRRQRRCPTPWRGDGVNLFQRQSTCTGSCFCGASRVAAVGVHRLLGWF